MPRTSGYWPFEDEIKKEELQQTEGARYLGAPIGTTDFKSEFFKRKMEKINEKIRKLARLAKTSPHATYHIFTASVKHELTYLQKIGVQETLVKETEVELKKFSESLVGQAIMGVNTNEQV